MNMGKMTRFLKRRVLPNLPYAVIFWFCCKLGEAYRLAYGADFLQRLTRAMGTLGTAMQNPLPSFDWFDLGVGLAGAAIVYGVVAAKRKNAKKYRKDVEYGSARWGKQEWSMARPAGANRRTSPPTWTRSRKTTSS